MLQSIRNISPDLKKIGGKLAGDSLWSVLSRIAPAVAMISNTAVLVRYLGSEKFGLISTLWATVMWGNFLNLGLSGALLNSLAFLSAKNDERGYARELGLGLRSLWGIVSSVLCIFLLISFFVNWGPVFAARNLLFWPLINRLVPMAAISFALSFASGALYPDFAARNQLGYYFKLNCITPLIGSITVLILAYLKAGSVFIAAGLWLVPNLILIICLVLGAGIRRISHSWTLVVWSEVLPMLRESKSFFWMQVSAVVMSATDVYLVSRCDTLINVTMYISINRLYLFSLALMSGLTNPIYPQYRKALARGDKKWMVNVFNYLRLGAMVYFLICVVASIWVIPSVARLWLGSAAEIQILTCILMACVVGLRFFSDIYGQLILATGELKSLVFVSLFQIFIYFGIYFLFGDMYKIKAVVCGLIMAYCATVGFLEIVMRGKFPAAPHSNGGI